MIVIITEEEKLLLKLEHERNIANTKDINSTNRIVYQSIVDFATLAIKSSIMINGGAAVSLLAFFGNIWKASSFNLAFIVTSLIYFSFGAVAACMGAGLSYLAQCCFLYDEEPCRLGSVFRYAAIFLVLLSYGFFIYGIYAISKIIS